MCSWRRERWLCTCPSPWSDDRRWILPLCPSSSKYRTMRIPPLIVPDTGTVLFPVHGLMTKCGQISVLCVLNWPDIRLLNILRIFARKNRITGKIYKQHPVGYKNSVPDICRISNLTLGPNIKANLIFGLILNNSLPWHTAGTHQRCPGPVFRPVRPGTTPPWRPAQS